jgi:hypothetical protein
MEEAVVILMVASFGQATEDRSLDSVTVALELSSGNKKL